MLITNESRHGKNYNFKHEEKLIQTYNVHMATVTNSNRGVKKQS